MGSKEQIFDHPSHPYTRALLSAAPAFTRKREGGEEESPSGGRVLPTPFNSPKSCRFVSRSQLKNQALVMVRETIYPFIKEVEELKVAQSAEILPEAEHSGFHGDLLLMI